MKLRNKKIGEIGNLVPHGCEDERRWDNAIERLLPEIQEKCFVKVYDKEILVRLLDLAEKAKDESKGGGE